MILKKYINQLVKIISKGVNIMAKNNGTATLCALLAYFFPIGLIWYLLDKNMKKDKFVAYHVYQSLAAFIVVTVGYLAASVLMIFLIGFLIYPLVMIMSLVWFIQGLIYSLSGVQKPLLFLDGLAKKFNF